jgi:hypothetical protein
MYFHMIFASGLKQKTMQILSEGIYLKTTRGQRLKSERVNVKGKASQRKLVLMQSKKAHLEDVNSAKVQRAIDRDNTILIAKKEVQKLKQASKNRRAQFAAKRKGL